MIYLKLWQGGMVVNHKRVDRLYTEAGQQSASGKKEPTANRHPLACSLAV